MRIPRSARYDKIMSTVHNFLLREKISSFPIDPFEIIKRNKWGLVAYSDLAKEYATSVDDIIKAFQSNDGYVILDSNNYTIAYNDAIEYPERIRFTLMHEIGHIELNHLEDFDETILLRSELTKDEYEILEREAHAFARNTLAPAPILNILERYRENSFSLYELKDNFQISNSAAWTRKRMLDWDYQHSKKYLHTFINHFEDYLKNMLFGKQCLNCQHYFAIKNALYCPICRHKRQKKQSRGYLNMYYESYSQDNEMRVTQCPQCKNESVGGNYCKICGMYLFNVCTGYDPDNNIDYRGIRWSQHNDGCDGFLEGNARFCYKCGSTTSFLEQDVFSYWKDEFDQNNSERQGHNQYVSTDSHSLEISDDNLPF